MNAYNFHWPQLSQHSNRPHNSIDRISISTEASYRSLALLSFSAIILFRRSLAFPPKFGLAGVAFLLPVSIGESKVRKLCPMFESMSLCPVGRAGVKGGAPRLGDPSDIPAVLGVDGMAAEEAYASE